ncbi:MAG TPA: O-antigen ligase domain-containing protein [Blastocatellia bacterium]|nr:O-antigen ligase domain-containing protein [Blastocatellia bacterium]HMV87065.1 O-antigen ligase domain-containing protein [Blastocatellia bacterium]HMX24503.1 O-antigen ligase domain-containing protein [Blastocatellia bacterium]HMZ17333.1 O-antigen ligase domain-containing protein [Blastocatellia bacterium]HNG30456.1 O-antigen ligase domain-containing protein [Blastocatellia bacterium]
MELVSTELGMTQVEEPVQGARRSLWAWAAIACVVLLVAGGLAVGQGSLVRLAFPALSFAVGLFLYWKHPVEYLVFAWWVWFLSPFIRRLVDAQSGWVDPSPVLLAPVMVSFLAGLGFLRHFLPSLREGGAPFVLAFAGVAYGLGVGLIRSNFDYTLAQPMMIWLTPIFLGFHLFHHWRDFPRYRAALQWTFLLGALLMGVYGVVQFLIAPEWDRFWMIHVEYMSFGKPEPLGIRVFSTLNAPGPFSVVMMACLLVLFSVRGWLKFPAAAGGYLSFLLCMTRAAWIGWLVAMVSLLASMDLKSRLRLIAVMIVLAAAVVPLAMMPPFSDVVGPRLQTMTKPKDDISLAARLEGYGKYLEDAFLDPMGKGVGVMERTYAVAADDEGIGPHDSAILELLLSLGLPGAMFYGIGLIALLFGLRPRRETRGDVFVDAARAIGFGMFAQLLLGSVMLGVMGAVLWSFSGVVMAAQKHHSWERSRSNIHF